MRMTNQQPNFELVIKIQLFELFLHIDSARKKMSYDDQWMKKRFIL